MPPAACPPASVWGLVALAGLLVVRVFVGVDLTDEIQYAYQMSGLVETGSLLSNDLYIQQFVYVLFYPLLKLHGFFFDQTGLILFGRLVFSLCLVGLYLFADRQFRKAGVAPLAASLSAFALCCAPAFHGLFAISYNTISQIGWCCAAILLGFRVAAPASVWAGLIVFAGLAHPISGFAIAVLFALDHAVRGQFAFLLRAVGLSLLLAVGLGSLLVWLSGGVDPLMRAVRFTEGFSVGSSLSDAETLERTGLFAVLMLVALVAPPLRRYASATLGVAVGVILVACLLLLRRHLGDLSQPGWSYAYDAKILYVWVVIACASLYAVRSCAAARAGTQATLWRLMAVLIVQFLVLVGTSSNGLWQGVGAFAVAVHLVTALAARTVERGPPRWLLNAPAFGVAVLVSCLVLFFPYRQAPLYALDRGISERALFEGLWVSQPVLDFAEQARQQILPLLPAQSGLILSPLPGLYPILSVEPQTCMIYTHSFGSSAALAALRSCLDEKSVPFVAHIRPIPSAPSDTAKLDLMQVIARERGLACATQPLRFSAPPPVLAPASQITVCR